jgi:hypothetical protein
MMLIVCGYCEMGRPQRYRGWLVLSSDPFPYYHQLPEHQCAALRIQAIATLYVIHQMLIIVKFGRYLESELAEVTGPFLIWVPPGKANTAYTV